jgi:amidase
MEASGSLDTLGILARSVDDAALYRDVLLGVPPQPLRDPEAPPRVGFCRTPYWDRIEPYARAALEGIAATLGRAGARVSDVAVPASFAALADAHRWISGFEMARNLAWALDHHRERISEAFRNARLADGAACTFERYRDALVQAERARLEMDALFAAGDVDVLLAPAAAGEAPEGSMPIPHPWVYMGWTVAHVPTITLPVSSGPAGLPLGAQFIARRHDDRRLFGWARWLDVRLR